MNSTNDNHQEVYDSSSDDDDVEDASSSPPSPTSRKKRDLVWCDVDGEVATTSRGRHHPPIKVVWPPASNATTSQWPQMRHYGNPYLGSKMQLYAQTGHHLAVYPDGTVRGTPDEDDLHTYLEVLSTGHVGHVRIRGLLAAMYVAMDGRGRLYGHPDPADDDDSVVFVETTNGSYNAYLSLKNAHLGWYLAIKKSGKPKRGPKTGHGQKAAKFLPRRSKFE